MSDAERMDLARRVTALEDRLSLMESRLIRYGIMVLGTFEVISGIVQAFLVNGGC